MTTIPIDDVAAAVVDAQRRGRELFVMTNHKGEVGLMLVADAAATGAPVVTLSHAAAVLLLSDLVCALEHLKKHPPPKGGSPQ